MNNYYQSELDDTRALHDQCKQYMHYHVTLTMRDGSNVDGIIQSVGTDGVHVLVGEDVMDRSDEQDERYYAGGYGYGFPRRRFRRFRPHFFPLASLAALALLPYVYPAPYPYSYPYPYPYPYY
ncbi:small nuclear ribonucleoprotein [Halalkalibacter alkaliphilus]|uniref:Small nuclear ribonucleoprotein n=1 Tax=Halalkalibacter alkaliphilus TaxID=2917993 RepID=A0A9X1ZZ71_9BACI|nr:small nuclear ribonucleoprotein [Halalkalibacter alkaliphilus]MCL7745750.1 small nuclear ribonucleoprotein [Halalkalibacter alkaliphilus]